MRALLTLASVVSAHTYTHKVGFIGAGNDVIPAKPSTLADAKALCSKTPKCVGLTFEASEASPAGTINKMYFKGISYVTESDPTWQTYLRDYVPPPPMLINPCLNASSGQAARPWCNATLPVATRVANMISYMSVAEKISQLGTSSPAVPSLNRKRMHAPLLLLSLRALTLSLPACTHSRQVRLVERGVPRRRVRQPRRARRLHHQLCLPHYHRHGL